MSTESNERPRVVILGGGFGGIGAARELKKADADVVVVDAHDYHTCLLYTSPSPRDGLLSRMPSSA